MSLLFRPQEIGKVFIMKCRRKQQHNGNYNFRSRKSWYPGEFKLNQRTIFDQMGRLHHLACHAPAPTQKKWNKAYGNFMDKHFGNRGQASMRYLNKWSCHSWL